MGSNSGTSPTAFPTTNPGDRSRFTFQSNWFDQDIVRLSWEEETSHLRDGRKMRILEVGAFEGASTTWMLDNLINHPDSTMTVIDTFAGGMEHQDETEDGNYGLGSLESRFRANVSLCKNAPKMSVIKSFSDEAAISLKHEGAKFDLIYIDASHVATDVLHDAVVCWRMLELGGTMVFDDWCWKEYNEHCYNPRLAIISFLQCAEPELKAKRTEAQIWITKVPNHMPATLNLGDKDYTEDELQAPGKLGQQLRWHGVSEQLETASGAQYIRSSGGDSNAH